MKGNRQQFPDCWLLASRFESNPTSRLQGLPSGCPPGCPCCTSLVVRGGARQWQDPGASADSRPSEASRPDRPRRDSVPLIEKQTSKQIPVLTRDAKHTNVSNSGLNSEDPTCHSSSLALHDALSQHVSTLVYGWPRSPKLGCSSKIGSCKRQVGPVKCPNFVAVPQFTAFHLSDL